MLAASSAKEPMQTQNALVAQAYTYDQPACRILLTIQLIGAQVFYSTRRIATFLRNPIITCSQMSLLSAVEDIKI